MLLARCGGVNRWQPATLTQAMEIAETIGRQQDKADATS